MNLVNIKLTMSITSGCYHLCHNFFFFRCKQKKSNWTLAFQNLIERSDGRDIYCAIVIEYVLVTWTDAMVEIHYFSNKCLIWHYLFDRYYNNLQSRYSYTCWAIIQTFDRNKYIYYKKTKCIKWAMVVLDLFSVQWRHFLSQ